MSEEAYNTKLNERVKDDFEIKDYFYYGDYLNIKHQKYEFGKSDETNQKTIILKNLCNDEEKPIILEQFIDRQIDLSKLEAGIYKMYISSDLVRKNVTTQLELLPFNTSTKNDRHKTITYVKNSSNGLHLKVEEITSPSEKVDIVVDTIYNHEDLLNALDTGYLKANEITFQQAKHLVEVLNNEGYRAQLGRENNEVKNVYGDRGRLQQLYQNSTKYYITLGIEHSQNKNISGIYIENSYLASKNLSNAIMYKITSNTNYLVSEIHNVNEYGVLRNEYFQGIDGHYYDGNLYIREVGGYATGAAQFSENSKKNESFALNNKFGIQGIYLSIGFQTNEKDMQLLSGNELVKWFVEGFKLQR